MRKLYYALLGIIGLILVGLLFGPSVLDWNSYKPQIMAAVKDALGRELRIVGDINLTMLPSPTLNVRRVSLGNIEGADNREMIAFDEVEVKIDASALLQGKIAVTSIRMIQPVIALEITKDGKTSWDIKQPKTPLAEPEARISKPRSEPASRLAVDISLDSILIENAIVSYTDARSGFTERIKSLTTEIKADSLNGPFRAEGRMAARGIPLSFDLAVGRIDPDKPLPIKLRTTHNATSSDMRFAGQLSGLTPDAVLSGKINLSVPNVTALAGSNGVIGLPPIASAALSLSAETSASAVEIAVNKMSLRLGEMSFAGAIHGQLKPTLGLDVVLSSSRVDLDRLLAPPTTPSKSSANSEEQPDIARAKNAQISTPFATASYSPFALPAGINVTFDLGVETATYEGGIIRNTSLRGSLERGVVTLETLSASLPGNSDLSVNGRITAVDDLPAFQGNVAVRSDNLKSLINWLGVASDQLPTDRLRNFSFTSKLKATPKSALVTDISIQLDASQIGGGIALELREKPGIGLRLAIDKLNLDAYFPKPSKMKPAPATARKGQDRKNPNKPLPALKPDRPAAVAATALNRLFNAVDANIELTAAHLIFAGETAQNVTADLTILNHAMTIRKASVADFAGIGASIAGNLAMEGNKPALSIDYSAVLHDPARLSRLLGAKLPLKAAQIKRVSSKGHVDGTLDALKADLRIEAAGASAQVKGVISRPLAAPSVDLRVSLTHPELSTVARNFSPSYRPAANKLGSLDIAASVVGDAKTFAIEKLDLKAGPVRAVGTIKGTFAGKRRKLDLDLKTSEVLLDLFLPKPQPVKANRTNTSGNRVSSSHRSIKSSGRTNAIATHKWSNDQLALPIPADVDAIARIEMAGLTKGNISLQTPRLRAVLSREKLTVEHFQAQVFGGAILGSATLQRSGKKVAVAAEFTIDKLDSRLAVKSLTGHDRVKGPITMKANITTKGNSEASFVNQLNGRASLTGQAQVLLTKAERKKIGIVSMGSNLLTSLLGRKVQELQRLAPLTQLLASLDRAFGRNPASVSGDIHFTQGVIRTNNLMLAGQGNVATTAAIIDLPRWELSSTTKLVDDPRREPLVTFSATGPIDFPSRTRVGGRLLKQGAASVREKASNPLQQILPGLLDGKPGGASKSDDPKNFNPGKLLEGIFKQFQR